jgi:nucleoside-diphosphate-sugar epimerase
MGAETNTSSYDAKAHVSEDGKEVPYQLVCLWLGEEALIKQGLPVTGVRGNFFMNHLMKNEGKNIKEHGFMELPLGECKNSFVCPNDMGEAATVCLLEGPEKHANKFYDICGPVPQSMHEVAADLSKAMGKKVEYRPMDPVEWEKNFGAVRALFRTYLRNGFYTRCSPHFYNLTGRKPTDYYTYLTVKGPHGENGVEELFAATGHVFAKGVDHYANVKK